MKKKNHKYYYLMVVIEKYQENFKFLLCKLTHQCLKNVQKKILQK